MAHLRKSLRLVCQCALALSVAASFVAAAGNSDPLQLDARERGVGAEIDPSQAPDMGRLLSEEVRIASDTDSSVANESVTTVREYEHATQIEVQVSGNCTETLTAYKPTRSGSTVEAHVQGSRSTGCSGSKQMLGALHKTYKYPDDPDPCPFANIRDCPPPIPRPDIAPKSVCITIVGNEGNEQGKWIGSGETKAMTIQRPYVNRCFAPCNLHNHNATVRWNGSSSKTWSPALKHCG